MAFDYMQAFQDQLPDSLVQTSRDLAEACQGSTIAGWKKFFADPATKRMIKEEMEEITRTNINQLVSTAGESRSVGQSQLLNSLVNFQKNTTAPTGPAIIYCHIPLTPEEEYSPVVGRVNGKKV